MEEGTVLKKTPDVCKRIEEILYYETAGDPISGLKWTHRTMEKISGQLKSIGICVSPNTVGKLLKEMKYSLRVNHKRLVSGTKDTKQKRINRDKQFRHIADVRKQYKKKGVPIISIDTKKKENIGNFKNNGKAWQEETVAVYDHDFPTDAKGKAIPYGIYDTQKNIGTVFVGHSADTPSFSVDCIEMWWKSEGKKHYPYSDKLLILADSGGSNSYRSRVWKYQLQKQLCDKHGLSVHICHYPPGSSKWNPIEHRLFSEISKNWAGRPLDSFETILKYLRTTKTSTGLNVNAHYLNVSPKEYYHLSNPLQIRI